MKIQSQYSKYIKASIYSFCMCLVMALSAQAQTEIEAATYLLQNVATGQFLNISDGSLKAKVLQQPNRTGKNTQRFAVEFTDEDNIYNLRALALDTINAYLSTGSSNSIVITEKPQDWEIDNRGTNSQNAFVIRQKGTVKVLTVNSETDPQVVLATIPPSDKKAQWRLVYILEPGRYKLRNISSGLYMSVVGGSRENGAKIEQAKDNDENWQLFDVVEIGQGEAYAISPVSTRKTKWFSVNRGTTTTDNPVGTPLFIQTPRSFAVVGDEQSWEIVGSGLYPDKIDIFTIRSLYQSSSKPLAIQNATTAAVVQSNLPLTDSRSQWFFEPVSVLNELEEGKFRIQNVATGKFMDVSGAGTANGTKVVQWGSSGTKNQTFKIIYEADKYRISPAYTYGTKWLSALETNNIEGTELFISDKTGNAQIWDIEAIEDTTGMDDQDDPETGDIADGIFTIRSSFSNKLLGVNDKSTTTIAQKSSDGKDPRFQWRFVYIEPDFDLLQEGRYLIQNVKTAKVMDVAAASQSDNAAVVQFNVSATDNQLFDVTEVGENQYRISPVHTNGKKWLSVYGGTATDRNANGKTLTQLGANPSLQTWDIVRAENDEDDAYTVRSTDPSSKKLLGVYSSTDRRIVQWNITDEADTRFQWRFMTVGEFENKQTNSVTSPALVVEKANANARIAALAESTNPDLTTKPQVVVYPNPVNGDFEVRITQFDAADNLNAQIVDMQGKSIYQNTIGTERSLKFNTQQMQMKSGTYLMEVNNGQQRHTTKIMVIE